MKEKFENAVSKIKSQPQGTPIRATWYDENGKETFSVELADVEAVEREDGWHLLGNDETGKEYCIGGAVITAVPDTIELYRP